MRTVIVVPSLKISGGNREALRLANELNRDAQGASVLTLWVSPHEMATTVPVANLSSWPPRAARALGELPILTYRFARWWRHAAQRAGAVIFTHYATLPLALLVPRRQRFFFVQDLEWNFVGSGPLSRLLRRIVLGIYRSGRIISANAYLSDRLAAEGMEVAIEAPIWADADFLAPDAPTQDVDFAMVLRKGDHKRLDLYLRFIALARARQLRVGVITPEDDIAEQVHDEVDVLLLRPKHAQMRDLYSRSTCFIHLSEHEGFGLPPLESMGAGCTPVCRDSGGVRAFMADGPFADLLLPLSMPLEQVLARAEAVVRDPAQIVRRASARAHFQHGLARCEQARRGLLAAMLTEQHR
jgi:glycosyltransferase involved in cell wall biosynthesis